MNGHGDRVAWFEEGGPGATMDYLLAGKLIDPDAPEKSLLLTRPLGAVTGYSRTPRSTVRTTIGTAAKTSGYGRP